MAPKDPDAEAEEKELTEEEKKKRDAFLEMLRQMAQQQGRAQPGSRQGPGPEPEPDIAGFTVTEDTAKRQMAEEAEKAKQGPQEKPHDDMFLKALAKVYGLPPQPDSFKPEFVPVLMATTLVAFEQEAMVQGKFASGGHELPVVQVTKQYAITKGGQMTPELAMHLAMIALSNPDMVKDGVEIKGKTEEEKLMLLAAAKLVGLKVKNEADIKIDSEQTMQQRIQQCQQGWANLQQWAAAGPAAPAPTNRPQSPDGKTKSDSAIDPATDAATGAAAEKLVDDSKKPGDGKDTKDEPKPQKWADLSDKKKDALRSFFRDTSSRFDDHSDAELDKEIEATWNGLDAKRQAALMQNADAAALQRKIGDEPAQTGKPVFDGLRTDDQKKLVTEYLRDQHPEYDLSDEDWEKQAAAIWNNKSPEERSDIFQKALADATRLEEKSAKRAEEAKNNAGKLPTAPPPAAENNSTVAEPATAAPVKPIVTAPPPPAEGPAPQLAPMHERKFADLLPEEAALLVADELAKRNEGKKRKATKLPEDAQKLLESEWDHGASDENKARLEKIASNPDLAKAAVLAENARQAEQQRLLAEHGKALAKLQKAHDKAVKEFEQAMAAADPDAPPEAPALKPVEKRSFDQLLPAEKKALRNLAEASRPDKDRNKAGEMWDDPALTPEARKERFEHATSGDANEKVRKEIERERKKALRIIAEAQARAAAATVVAQPPQQPAASPVTPPAPVDSKGNDSDKDDGAQASAVPVTPPDNPDAGTSSASISPTASVPAKQDAATPVLPPPVTPAPDAQIQTDQSPAKSEPPKAAVTPVKGTRTFDQLSQAEQDALWEYMTVTTEHSKNDDGTLYSKQQLARTWNNIKTVGEQISTLDFVKKENAKAHEAAAKKQADNDDEHSKLVARDFSQLLRAEQYLLEQDFNKRKPEGVANAEAEWNSLDAKGRGNRITLAELGNPDLGKYLNRARRMDAAIQFVPHKFDELLPEERALLEADFEKRKPEGVASAQAEWDAMDDRHKDFHMDRALVGGGELTGPVLGARKALHEPKPAVEVQEPKSAPAPKQRGRFREFLSSIWNAINPMAGPTAQPPAAERKEPVLTLPPPETTPDTPREPVVAVSDDKPVAANTEIAGAAPGVDEASKKKFADLLEQEQKMLRVDYLARNGSAMGNAWEQEWDSASDDAARANLFNHAWQKQPQMHDRVVADQEKHKAPVATTPESERGAPVPAEVSNGGVSSAPPVVELPATPREPDAVKMLDWDKLSSIEQGVLTASDPSTPSQWGTWNAETRDELYRVALLESEQKAKTPDAGQQAVKPVVEPPAPPATPPVVPEAEKLEMPPETDTEFDAALQAKGHSRSDLANMGIDRARDLIATIRREQDEAKKAAQQQPVVESHNEPAPVAAEPPKQSVTSTFNITVEGVKTLPPSEDAIRILANNGLKDEKYQKAYQAIRAEVIEQQARCPGFHVSRKFLSQAANNAQLDNVLGHKGLDPKEQNAMLECLRKEGVTTGKGPAVRDQNFGASNWDKNLASHYPSGPTASPG